MIKINQINDISTTHKLLTYNNEQKFYIFNLLKKYCEVNFKANFTNLSFQYAHLYTQHNKKMTKYNYI